MHIQSREPEEPDAQSTEFTVISLNGTIPERDDRRTGQRYMTVLQTGKLTGPDGDELCLIRNISSHGAMLELFSERSVEDAIVVKFRAGVHAEASIRWVENNRCGIQFSETIDVQEVLSPGTNRFQPRAPRVSVDGRAKIEFDGDKIGDARIVDISQGGVKVSTEVSLTEDQHVVMAIDGLPLRAGTVCGVEDGVAGINFSRTLPLEEVAAWASAHAKRKMPALIG